MCAEVENQTSVAGVAPKASALDDAEVRDQGRIAEQRARDPQCRPQQHALDRDWQGRGGQGSRCQVQLGPAAGLGSPGLARDAGDQVGWPGAGRHPRGYGRQPGHVGPLTFAARLGLVPDRHRDLDLVAAAAAGLVPVADREHERGDEHVVHAHPGGPQRLRHRQAVPGDQVRAVARQVANAAGTRRDPRCRSESRSRTARERRVTCRRRPGGGYICRGRRLALRDRPRLRVDQVSSRTRRRVRQRGRRRPPRASAAGRTTRRTQRGAR